MSPPAALLFDLDGTLVDSAVTIAAALSELSSARGGGPVAVAATRRLVGKGAPVLVREALGPLAADSEADVAAFRAILAGIPSHPAMIFPGVLDALQTFVAAGHSCAVVTNKPQHLAALLLDQLGLARYFAAVVGGDSLAVCKPDPAPLRHALELMTATDLPATMIGDSDIDARAAAAAGIPFVLYRAGYDADLCPDDAMAASFDHFAQLPEVLHQLC